MFSTLANQLTLSRILVIPVILTLLTLKAPWAGWLALGLFIAAGFTDWLDGYVARQRRQISKIGQFLDPIADKLLVSAVILVLVQKNHITETNLLPAIIILLREVAVSGLREFLAGLRVSVPVNKLAKWKTFIQIVALSFLIIGDHAPKMIPAIYIGNVFLWIAAGLTLITASTYWRASLKHFKD